MSKLEVSQIELDIDKKINKALLEVQNAELPSPFHSQRK